MSSTAPRNRPHWPPWSFLLDRAPFKIDALGLVTLLGAEEVNACVGRLVRSTYLEYLPLLGAFVIAGERFLEKQPGFNLYNISNAIHTTDLAPWLTRWMISQNFEQTRSFVVWRVVPRRSFNVQRLIALLISFFSLGILTGLTILSYDFYGFANAMAMIVSIIVRCYIISANRQCIDDQVTKAEDETRKQYIENLEKYQASGEKTTHEEKVKLFPKVMYGPHGKQAKVLIIMSDSKAVTMMIPGFLLRPPSVFIADLHKRYRFFYLGVRMVGWVAFAVHIIAIGMADLTSQLVSVFLLVVPTVLLYEKLGCDDSKWSETSKSLIRLLFRVGRGSNTTPNTNITPRELDAEFILKTRCHIGSRLLAEVYEWPMSYEFVVDDAGNLKSDEIFDINSLRSEKRQHLYAWLQFTTDEEESVDKWDLTPHKRPVNERWMIQYREQQNRISDMDGGPYIFQERADVDPPEQPSPSSAASVTNKTGETTTVTATVPLERRETRSDDGTTNRIDFARRHPEVQEFVAPSRASTMPTFIRSSWLDTDHGVTGTRENTAYWLTNDTASFSQPTTTEDTPGRRLSRIE